MRTALGRCCLYPFNISPSVTAMSAPWVESRRAASKRCGDSRVYGHMTAGMHEIGSSPRPLLPPNH